MANQNVGVSRWSTLAELGNRTALANQSAANQVALANAGLSMDAQRANQGASLQVGQVNAQGGLQAGIANQGAAGDAMRIGLEQQRVQQEAQRMAMENDWRAMADATERYSIAATLQRAQAGGYTGPVGGYRPAGAASQSSTAWRTMMGDLGMPEDTRPYTPLGGVRTLYSRSQNVAAPMNSAYLRYAQQRRQ
jgi:hypothetical protein